jgi:UbiD family decarboxylase
MTAFRTFLEALEAAGELRRIRTPVDPAYELGAILRRISDEQGPAILFEAVGGSPVPVAANLFGTRRRVAMGLGLDLETMVTDWAGRLDDRVPARLDGRSLADQGLERVPVDLGRLPHPTLNEKDGGPFITAGVVCSIDPEGGARNAAIYRLQVYGPARLGILSSPHRDAGRAIVNARAREEDLPIAISIGVDPALFVAACSPISYGTFEADVAGALRGAPLTLSPIEHGGLAVPEAEIVLEGWVRTRERATEGPFGEFTGYYGPPGERPVIDVTAMYLRPDPILQIAYIGYPITETQVLQTASGDPTAYQQLKPMVPGLVAVHMPPSSGGQPIMYMSLRKRSQGEAGSAILAAMASKSRPKYVVVVDDDIDVTNETMVLWALATRSSPDRGVYLVEDTVGMTLDPMSTHTPGRFGTSVTAAKLGIDATIALDRPSFPEVIRPHPEVARLVAERWSTYLAEPVPTTKGAS